MFRRWLVVAFPLALAITGCLVRSGYAVTPLEGTWLGFASTQLFARDISNDLGAQGAVAWAWSAIAGLFATFWIRTFDTASLTTSWRTLLDASKLLVPIVVASGISPLAWPFSLLLPLFIIAVPILSVGSLVCLTILISRQVPKSSQGIYFSCRDFGWSLFALTVLDWVNLLLLGVS